MTLDEGLNYVEDINRTVGWTKDQVEDADFFLKAAEWLEELKELQEEKEYWDMQNNRAYESGRVDAIDEYNKLIHKLDEDFTKEHPKDGSTLYFWLGKIDQISEQLKKIRIEFYWR